MSTALHKFDFYEKGFVRFAILLDKLPDSVILRFAYQIEERTGNMMNSTVNKVIGDDSVKEAAINECNYYKLPYVLKTTTEGGSGFLANKDYKFIKFIEITVQNRKDLAKSIRNYEAAEERKRKEEQKRLELEEKKRKEEEELTIIKNKIQKTPVYAELTKKIPNFLQVSLDNKSFYEIIIECWDLCVVMKSTGYKNPSYRVSYIPELSEELRFFQYGIKDPLPTMKHINALCLLIQEIINNELKRDGNYPAIEYQKMNDSTYGRNCYTLRYQFDYRITPVSEWDQ